MTVVTRRSSADSTVAAASSTDDKHADELRYTLEQLSYHPSTLIALNGIIYHLPSLIKKHPGGHIINMLGGIDATLHYRTLHPFHSNKQWLWLQQFRVGSLIAVGNNKHLYANQTSEELDAQMAAQKSSKNSMLNTTDNYASTSSIDINSNSKINHIVNCWDNGNSKYDLDTAFGQELKSSVQAYFVNNNISPDATYGWWCRAVFVFAMWAYGEFMWITAGPSVLRAMHTVLFSVLLGMNVAHEANHGSVSYKHPIINNTLGYCMDIMGQSKYLWLQVHNYSHHIFVNETACDHDTTSGEPFISFDVINSIKHKQQRWWWAAAGRYRYGKHVMALFFLQFYRTLMMLDFSAICYMYKYDDNQTFNNNSNAHARRIPRPVPWLMQPSQRYVSVAIHTVHVLWSYLPLLLMVYNSGFSRNTIGYALLCCYVRDAGISLGLSLNFLISHNFEGCERKELDTAATATTDATDRPVDWYKMSIESSSNYGDYYSIIATGGLSHQIEHHVFAKVNSAHYTAIKPIIRAICKKHNVKYANFDNMPQHVMSMLRYVTSIH